MCVCVGTRALSMICARLSMGTMAAVQPKYRPFDRKLMAAAYLLAHWFKICGPYLLYFTLAAFQTRISSSAQNEQRFKRIDPLKLEQKKRFVFFLRLSFAVAKLKCFQRKSALSCNRCGFNFGLMETLHFILTTHTPLSPSPPPAQPHPNTLKSRSILCRLLNEVRWKKWKKKIINEIMLFSPTCLCEVHAIEWMRVCAKLFTFRFLSR